MAAEAWGARRTWFLINGASQGNHAACLALAQARRPRRGAAKRPLEHRRRAGPLGDEADVRGAGARRGARRSPTAWSPRSSNARSLRRRTPLGRSSCRRPTSARSRTCARSRRSRTGTAFRSSWTRPGARTSRFHESLPEDALSAGADLVISSTHKLVGSLTQSAMLHLGRGADGLLDEHIVDRAVTLVESTSPSALLSGSLDAARRHAADRRPRAARRRRSGRWRRRARAIRELPGLDVLDERLVGRPGVHDYDPLRLAVDVRGTGASGYELADVMREQDDINLELAGENVIVAVFGMGEPAAERGRPARRRRSRTRSSGSAPVAVTERRTLAHAAAVGPARDESARGVSRRSGGRSRSRRRSGGSRAESLAAYPPGIPNVLPGERLTAETLDLHPGDARSTAGRCAARATARLRTARVAVEALDGGAALRPAGRLAVRLATRASAPSRAARTSPSPTGVDVAVVGVAVRHRDQLRPGARFGPEAIRAASMLLRPYHPVARRGRVPERCRSWTGATSTLTPGNAERTTGPDRRRARAAARGGRRPDRARRRPLGHARRAARAGGRPRPGGARAARRARRHLGPVLRRALLPRHPVPARRRRKACLRRSARFWRACGDRCTPRTISRRRGSWASS